MLNINDLNSYDIDLSNNELIKGIYMNNNNIIFDIIKQLKIGGECIIVLPYNNSFYNKDNNDYVYLRKFLLKTCNLKELIYLPIGMFNINIKLCILYFIKNNEKPNNNYETETINFYDYNLFDNSKQLLVSSNIDDMIIKNFSFNYTDYIKECPLDNKHFIIKTLNDIANITYGDVNGNDNVNVNANEGDEKYKIYGCKSENNMTSKYNREGFNIIITKFKVFLTEEKLFLNNYAVSIKPKTNIISDKYLGYYLLNKYKNINLKTLKNLEISIPPIEVQEEIVNYIDINNNIIINLKNEIDDLKYKSSLWFHNIN